MPDPTRETLFRDAAALMRAEFEEIRNSVPHRGEKGAEGENIVRAFLDRHLPGRFGTGSGFILDKEDAISGHTDIIIYDAFNCPVYRSGDRTMIIPNDNVAGVVEVKFVLTTTHLDSALDKIHEVKNLKKTPFLPGHPEGEQIRTYGVIFGFESDLGFETVVDRWKAKLTDSNPLSNSCSLIVVLDKGIFITVANIPGQIHVAPIDFQGEANLPRGTKVGIGYLETAQATLDALMRLLLPHLTIFRHRVDHPGFKFSTLGPSKISWLFEAGS